MSAKKLIAIIVAIAMLAVAVPLTKTMPDQLVMAVYAAADSDFEYSVNGDGETVTLTKYVGSETEVVIPSVLDGKAVTKIGDYAFEGCTSLISVTIPDSVTSIGVSAFMNCSELTSITIPDSVTLILWGAFQGCSALTSVTIPNSVTIIQECAFGDCSSLEKINVEENNANYLSLDGVLFNKDKSILICYPAGKKDESYEIPDSVTSIGDWTFAFCSALTSITIPDSVTSIGEWTFFCSALTSITIPDSVTSIGTATFSNCSALTSITIPDSVTSIGNIAFGDCSALTSITIPNGVTSIGDRAFENCSALTSIIIPYGVTSIEMDTFNGCSALTSITIPDSVTSIGDRAFENCSALTSIIIPYGVTSIEMDTFNGCSALTSITIPDSVTSIGDRAFENCSALTSIIIPYGVTSIENDAFYRCSALEAINVEENNANYLSLDGVLFNKDISTLICYPAGKKDESYEIPNCVTSIVDYAFHSCSALTSITIPNSVTSIGNSAFEGCSALEAINVEENNANYLSLDGVLFNKDISTLICYPEGKKDESYEIPNCVTIIKSRAFCHCSALTSITIPNSVTTIGYSIFERRLRQLETVYYGGTKAEWEAIEIGTDNYCLYSAEIICTDGIINERKQFEYNYTVNDDGESVTIIKYVGEDTDVVIPSVLDGMAVTVIGRSAFEDNHQITSVTIPDSVTSIGDSAFFKCSALTSIAIPNSVTSIGSYAFVDCSALTSITIPDSVTSIGNWAFGGCSALTSITIPDSVTRIYVSSIPYHNSQLKTIYYGGTKAEWEAKLAYDLDAYTGKELANIEIICTDGIINERTPEPSDTTEPEETQPEETQPEETQPEETQPEETEPEETQPEETQPEETQPEETQPEETQPEETQPEETQPEETQPEETKPEETQPEETQPEETQPEETEPEETQPEESDITNPEELKPGDYFIKGNLLFTVLKDGTAEVRGFAEGEESELIIPETVRGLTVTSIADAAFMGRASIISAEIPDTVTRIGGFAFYGCDSLETVKYGGTKSQWEAIYIDTDNDPLLNANIIFSVEIVDEDTGVKAEADADDKELEDAELEADPADHPTLLDLIKKIIEKIVDTAEEVTEEAQKSLNEAAKSIKDGNGFAYNIGFKKGGKEVQPGKPVIITVPVPDEFKDDINRINVYHLTDKGAIFVPSSVKNGSIVFEADSFSPYVFTIDKLKSAITSEGTSSADTDPSDKKDDNGINQSTGWAITATPILLTSIFAAIVAKKKK